MIALPFDFGKVMSAGVVVAGRSQVEMRSHVCILVVLRTKQGVEVFGYWFLFHRNREFEIEVRSQVRRIGTGFSLNAPTRSVASFGGKPDFDFRATLSKKEKTKNGSPSASATGAISVNRNIVGNFEFGLLV